MTESLKKKKEQNIANRNRAMIQILELFNRDF